MLHLKSAHDTSETLKEEIRSKLQNGEKHIVVDKKQIQIDEEGNIHCGVTGTLRSHFTLASGEIEKAIQFLTDPDFTASSVLVDKIKTALVNEGTPEDQIDITKGDKPIISIKDATLKAIQLNLHRPGTINLLYNGKDQGGTDIEEGVQYLVKEKE